MGYDEGNLLLLISLRVNCKKEQSTLLFFAFSLIWSFFLLVCLVWCSDFHLLQESALYFHAIQIQSDFHYYKWIQLLGYWKYKFIISRKKIENVNLKSNAKSSNNSTPLTSKYKLEHVVNDMTLTPSLKTANLWSIRETYTRATATATSVWEL